MTPSRWTAAILAAIGTLGPGMSLRTSPWFAPDAKAAEGHRLAAAVRSRHGACEARPRRAMIIVRTTPMIGFQIFLL
jgi:hypothetical protein